MSSTSRTIANAERAIDNADRVLRHVRTGHVNVASPGDERLPRPASSVIRLWDQREPVISDDNRRAQAAAYRTASLYHACVQVRAKALGQPRMYVERDGKEVSPEKDLFADFIANPNRRRPGVRAQWTPRTLKRRKEADIWTFGETWSQKLRSVEGEIPREEWPLDPAQVGIMLVEGTDEELKRAGLARGAISHYVYGPEAYRGIGVRIEVDDMIHLKRYNPTNPYRGLSPATTLVLENNLDHYALLYLGGLFENGGIPHAILSLVEDVDDDKANQYKARWRELYGKRYGVSGPGGTGYGEIAVFGQSAKVEKFGLEPDNLDLSGVTRLSESRVAAVIEVPALLAELSVGSEHSAAYGHLKETRIGWWLETAIDEHEWMTEELTLQLGPDFGEPGEYKVRSDYRTVPVLRGARSSEIQDAVLAFRANLWDRNRSLEYVGDAPADLTPVYAAALGLSPPRENATQNSTGPWLVENNS